MTIDQITIYPIKGLGGISLSEAYAMERGFEHDRRYMLVDHNGKFLSQREIPNMALIKCHISNNQLEIKYLDQLLNVDLQQEDGELIDTTIWKHQVNAIEISNEAHDWFSDLLGVKCKLVKMNKQSHRKKSLIKSPKTTDLSFADGYPYLILGSASLENLNQKLQEALPYNRFRANIVISTKIAHHEDELDKIQLGDYKFRIIKPCARCHVITINQDTGQSGKEPLKTLAGYRKISNKIYFGANAICLEEGPIRVGDKLIEL